MTRSDVPSPTSSRLPMAAGVGRMTAVMRAVSTSNAPRVLRVGIVREGRIVEERVIKKHATVTIGRDEGATFVVDEAPANAAIFERELGAYFLNLRAPIAGRIAVAGVVHEIAALRQSSQGRLRLDDSARGRIAIGNATLLFQFVPLAPDSPKPHLPLAVRDGVKIDTSLLFVTAASFLLHFGVVGAMYSDWSDPIVDESITVGTLIDLNQRDLTWTPATPANPEPTTTEDVTPRETTKHDSQRSPHPSPEPRAPSPSHLDAIAREAQVMGMGILTSIHAGSAVEAALARDVPPVDLTDAVKRAGGVMNAGDDLHMVVGSLLAPTLGHGLDHIAGGTIDGTGSHARVVDVKPPPFQMTVEPSQASTPLPGAEQAIAKLRPQIRRCYERGLAADPSMAGAMIVRVKIAPNGEVNRAVVASGSGLSSEVSACIVRLIDGATFDRTANGATLDVPVKMLQQTH